MPTQPKPSDMVLLDFYNEKRERYYHLERLWNENPKGLCTRCPIQQCKVVQIIPILADDESHEDEKIRTMPGCCPDELDPEGWGWICVVPLD